MSDDNKSREIRGIIDEGFPLLTKKEAGVEDGRKGDKRKWVMTGGGGREEETNFEMKDINAMKPESCFVKRVNTHEGCW